MKFFYQHQNKYLNLSTESKYFNSHNEKKKGSIVERIEEHSKRQPLEKSCGMK
jgi:hypothetical protein